MILKADKESIINLRWYICTMYDCYIILYMIKNHRHLWNITKPINISSILLVHVPKFLTFYLWVSEVDYSAI